MENSDQQQSLQQENEQLRYALAHSKTKVDSLTEQIRVFLAHRFGASSEKVLTDQINLLNEAESLAEGDQGDEANADDIPFKSHQRTRQHSGSDPT